MKIKYSHYHQIANQHGVSLVEIVVASAIMGIVAAFASALIIEGTRVQDFISQQTDAVAEANKAITTITTYVREAADGDNGEYAIIDASGNQLMLYSDLDADSKTERITYYLDDTRFIQSVVEPTGDPAVYDDNNAVETILSNHIINQTVYDNDVFTYYNGDYPDDMVNNPLTAPVDITDVTLVRIHLDVNINPNRIPDTSTVETFIQIRNLKSNL